MQATKFSPTSWHFRLASIYGNLKCNSKYHSSKVAYDGNSCDYIWAVFKGFLMCVVIVFVGAFVLYPFADLIAWCVASLVTGNATELSEIATVGAATLVATPTLIVSIFAFFKIKEYITEVIHARSYRYDDDDGVVEVSEPWFITTVFHKIKNKICTRVLVQYTDNQ